MDMDPTQPQQQQSTGATGRVLGSVLAGTVLGMAVGGVTAGASQLDFIQDSVAHDNYDMGKPTYLPQFKGEQVQNIAEASKYFTANEMAKFGVNIVEKDPTLLDHAVHAVQTQAYGVHSAYAEAVNSGLTADNAAIRAAALLAVPTTEHAVSIGNVIQLNDGRLVTISDKDALLAATGAGAGGVSSVDHEKLTEILSGHAGVNRQGAAVTDIVTTGQAVDAGPAPVMHQAEKLPDSVNAYLSRLPQQDGGLVVPLSDIEIAAMKNMYSGSAELNGHDYRVLVDRQKFDADHFVDALQVKASHNPNVDIKGDISIADGVKWGGIIGGGLGGLKANDEAQREQRQMVAAAPAARPTDEFAQQNQLAQQLLMRRAAMQEQMMQQQAAMQQAAWRQHLERGETQGVAHQGGWQQQFQPQSTQPQMWQQNHAPQSQTVETGDKKWAPAIKAEAANATAVGAALRG